MVMLQSADSDPFIRTMDMAPFTCFYHEDEHLIFETRCRIKDIWMQREKMWIGSEIMITISLYDQLIHGTTVLDNAFLTKKV